MSDQTTTFAQIKEKIRSFVEEREWQQFHSPKNLSMAIAAEAAELMEHFLWDDADQSRKQLADPGKSDEIAREIADIVIYTIEFANEAGIDLTEAIAGKLERNALKYPVEKSRGNCLKYTEL